MQTREPSTDPTLSVVIPVYGCAGCLEILCNRVEKSLESITRRYEIVLVDDRSPDHAWSVIRELQDSHPAVKGVRLSRNFGQQIAITAGPPAPRGEHRGVMGVDVP